MKLRLCYLDWDESLLCSNHINRLIGPDKDKPIDEIRDLLAMSDLLIVSMLNVLARCGYMIYIITNAELGWVELSSSKYLPKVLEYLTNHKVPIISANTRYSQIYPGDVMKWKELAFIDVIRELLPRPITTTVVQWKCEEETIFVMDEDLYAQTGYLPEGAEPHSRKKEFKVISLTEAVSQMSQMSQMSQVPEDKISSIELLSIGDAVFEEEAAKKVSKTISIPVVTKIVKLSDHPCVNMIISQIQYLISHLEDISGSIEDVSITISRTPTTPVSMPPSTVTSTVPQQDL